MHFFRWTRGQKNAAAPHSPFIVLTDIKTNKWEKKKITKMAESNQTQCIAMDSATALQRYLDHIPVSSISGIKSSVVLEVKTGDFVKDALRIMFKKNVASALIADVSTDGFPDRFIGFVHLSSLLLWCIQVLPMNFLSSNIFHG
ncbi:hypothetical protein IC582_025159 [Cucumis melo]